MRELPPIQLAGLLQSLGLATESDLQNLEPTVHRLAGDLPRFETVWIDALRRARLLTQFQAAEIVAGRGEALRVGRYVVCHVVQECGYATVYRARQIESREAVRLATAMAPTSPSDAIVSRFDRLIQLTPRLLGVYGLVTSAGMDGIRTWAASPWVEGTSLADWMLHHGRFPPEVALEIARAMVAQLAAMELAGLVHGDIRAENVLLLPDGGVCLPHPGVRAIIRPHEGIADCDLAPEACSTLAPERVSRGTPPTAASDLFACGCVWWQMLCGRPALGGGDSLARLRAAQSAAIDDFRHWATDVPKQLGDALDACLEKDPRRRPLSMAALAEQLGPLSRGGRKAIVRCLAASDRPHAPWLLAKRAKAKKKHPHLLTAATLLLLAAIAVVWPLWVAANRPRSVARASAQSVSVPAKAASHEPLKHIPDSAATSGTRKSSVIQAGFIEPVSSRDELRLPPSLSITADELKLRPGQTVRPQAERTRIVAPPQGIAVTADRVTFENIDFVANARSARDAGCDDGSPALLRLFGAECTFVGCSFQSTAGQPELSAAIRWTQGEQSTIAAALPSGRVRLRDCVFRRVAAGIESSRRGAIVLEAVNVLHLGPGPFVRLRHCGAADEPLRISLAQVTLRDAESLVELHCPAGLGNAATGEIVIDATGCVVAPRVDRPLLLIAGDEPPAPLLRGLKWNGQGSVLTPLADFARWQRRDESTEVIDDMAISICGLVRGQVVFSGPSDARPSNSRVVECHAPLMDSESPGANAARLPADVESAGPTAP
jgi:serine/threonine-protein kinase